MADTILMIHGMWGGPWYWSNYRRVFEAHGYRCVATTLPYHDMDPQGVPDSRLGTASLLDYAEALELEIRQMDEKPIVMGHSMGGLLAQILGARGLAKSLVLLTPASPSGILALKPSVIRSFWSVMTKWGFWRKPMRQTFGEAVYSMLHLLPKDEQKQAYDKFVYESGRAAFEIGYWLFDARGASKVDDSKVTCPVLVVAGAQDRITPASVVRKVAQKYKAVSTYKEFENHAHWVVAEPLWQEVAEYIGGWLTRPQAEN
ncbi:alpha/beta hydrolase [uncultured Desulfosarcina sp.]|uniref:alpha/beta hydrolase n=1 Tax=uncultured Desulfosarcina sp. TaxID=218289 RepID=UPI0029C93DE3|nr:alpha/beta hydrolase [uncultured Desulfosarcina sp.]